MPKNTKATVTVKGTTIGILSVQSESYISLTDIARHKDPERTDYVIQNWIRSRNTIEFLGVWETINNPGFKPIEFDGFRKRAGLNSFVLTARQWIDATGAIGIVSKQGRYGGTYAHKDIAFEFATWISVEFKLYLIKEFQRLKEAEAERLKTGWDVQRTLSKDRIYNYMAGLAFKSLDFKDTAVNVTMTADIHGRGIGNIQLDECFQGQIQGWVEPLIPLKIFRLFSQESLGLGAAGLFARGLHMKHENGNIDWYSVFKEKIKSEQIY